MKTTTLLIAVLATVCMTTCCHSKTNKQEKEESMNKNIPENTLSVIKSEGRVVYLTDIHRIPLETKGYPKDSWYGKAQDAGYGGEFIYFSFIEGNYPDDYTQESYFLHIVPENTEKTKIELKLWLSFYGFFENHKFVTDGEPKGLWEDAGYSTDSTLWAEIVEYYMENKDKRNE